MEQKYHEPVSVVAQAAYNIQTFLATGGEEKGIPKLFETCKDVKIPNFLEYKKSVYNVESGTCGVAFLNKDTQEIILAFSGTNIGANKVKDLHTDLQIVLGYATLEKTMEKVQTYFQKQQLFFDTQTEKSRIAQLVIDPQPTYIQVAYNFYLEIQKLGYPIILTGHSLGGNIATIVALLTDHPFTILFNSAPLYMKNDGDFVKVIDALIEPFTGKILRFVSENDPLTILAEKGEGCYLGERFKVFNKGAHLMFSFFKPSAQIYLELVIENEKSFC